MTDLSGTDRAIRAMRRQPLFAISADRGWAQRFQLAGEDLREGFVLWRLSWALALADIRLRYRGSMLGPFWLTLSTAVMIGSMGFLYADLFHTDIHKYLPYLAVSLILWSFMSTLIADGCVCFTGSEGLIKGTRMPFTVHTMRCVFRNVIVLAHNVIVIALVFLLLGVHVSTYALLAIPGLALWIVNGFAMAFLVGTFCARFRDVPQIIASIIQIAFFVTPVIWNANILNTHPRAFMLIRLNPFYYMMEIIRAPLLGTPLSLDLVLKALIVTAVLIAMSSLIFARTRGRLAYWM
jgi:lipopolysaccharide transport system permease protein